MRIINPNYIATAQTAITAARWAAMLSQAQAYIASHPDVAYFDAAQVQALMPELADPELFQKFLRALNLSVVG